MTERDFKGVWIPREIYLADDMTWTDKLVLVEIDSFTQNGKQCFVSNDHLAKFIGVSATSISKSISRLKKKGYIKQTDFDGRKRILQSCLEVRLKPALQNMQGRVEPDDNHTNTTTVTKDLKDTPQSKEERELFFRKDVYEENEKQGNVYQDKMIKAFCDYWTESKPKGKKLRFEMQRVFDINRRLKTWASKSWNVADNDTSKNSNYAVNL